MSEPSGSLRKDCLGFSGITAMAIALISPTMTAALIVPLMYSNAGNASWLAYLFGTVMPEISVSLAVDACIAGEDVEIRPADEPMLWLAFEAVGRPLVGERAANPRSLRERRQISPRLVRPVGRQDTLDKRQQILTLGPQRLVPPPARRRAVGSHPDP